MLSKIWMLVSKNFGPILAISESLSLKLAQGRTADDPESHAPEVDPFAVHDFQTQVCKTNGHKTHIYKAVYKAIIHKTLACSSSALRRSFISASAGSGPSWNRASSGGHGLCRA
jgi:hypothetical protein